MATVVRCTEIGDLARQAGMTLPARWIEHLPVFGTFSALDRVYGVVELHRLRIAVVARWRLSQHERLIAPSLRAANDDDAATELNHKIEFGACSTGDACGGARQRVRVRSR